MTDCVKMATGCNPAFTLRQLGYVMDGWMELISKREQYIWDFVKLHQEASQFLGNLRLPNTRMSSSAS